jgi:alpha-glucosidase
MQWDASDNAGFSTADPWLPLADGWWSNNAADLRGDPRSILNLYRRLLRLRKETPALSVGSYGSYALDDNLLVYCREFDDTRLLVALNLTDRPQSLIVEDGAEGKIVLSTASERDGERVPGTVRLAGDEGTIIALAGR